ncbi:NAD(P)-binding protein [Aureobasidium sp. EXF-12298]|nr:NAD(P)-binding protein [Aureobasidium sp. EXF-12298]
MASKKPNPLEQSGGLFTSKRHSSTYDYISPLKLNLEGKHVLITGAAWETGVGHATATALARAGASAIAVTDLHGVSQDLVEQLKLAAVKAGRPEPLILSNTVDISSRESVEALYKVVEKAFDGRLDLVINNAAHMEGNKSLLDSDPDTIWRTWEVNVHGLIIMARALNVRPGSANYRSSKLAILRWTESLQVEYGEAGLLTFCVNPGAIKTKISEGIAPEEIRNKFPDSPDLAGDTIAWLAAKRREWLGGRYVSCPWDMEELVSMEDEIVKEDKLKLRLVF